MKSSARERNDQQDVLPEGSPRGIAFIDMGPMGVARKYF